MKPSNMSHFDELSECFVEICADPSRQPVQWIFSVDDAWFHPEGFEHTAHNLNEPIWQAKRGKRIKAEEAMSILLTDNGPAKSAANGKVVRSKRSTVPQSALPLAEKIHDAAVAQMLISFATNEKNYGICFCSFEYLWANFAKQINFSQNSIFFDLNHQIAGILQNATDTHPTSLLSEWADKLKGVELFDDSITNDTKVYGWLLYFTIRFGRLQDVKCAVHPNHLLLVSSAIAGQAGSSEDAMTQFLQVQLSMWTKLSSADANIQGRQMTDFSFAPLPKVVTKGDPNASLLDTGLKIFNNTFKIAANWEAIRRLLLDDMVLLWIEAKNAHDANCVSGLTNACVRCHNWIEPLSENMVDADCGWRDIYHYYCSPNGTNHLAAKSLLNFLKMAGLGSGLKLPPGCDDWKLIFPATPGISFLIGIADLFHRMSDPAGHAGRKSPKVIIRKYDKIAPGLEVVLTVKNCQDVKNLAIHAEDDANMTDQQCKGAIYRVNHGAQVLLYHLKDRNGVLIAPYHSNDDTCKCGKTRECILKSHYSSALASNVIFDKKSICFRFAKSN